MFESYWSNKSNWISWLVFSAGGKLQISVNGICGLLFLPVILHGMNSVHFGCTSRTNRGHQNGLAAAVILFMASCPSCSNIMMVVLRSFAPMYFLKFIAGRPRIRLSWLILSLCLTNLLVLVFHCLFLVAFLVFVASFGFFQKPGVARFFVRFLLLFLNLVLPC